ncbi:MAG: cytoplasmic protein [Candidatus Aminicenantes bacterium RBG_13_62_12]|nr:MAG: cytoplasmic protein [Candidatus Aminicenantes bacterium RBG_13_62_12]
MKRREFMRNIALGGLALGAVRKPARPVQAAAKPPDLAWVEGESPAAITRAALEALGGMKSFVSRGDVVCVKPNIGWDRTPELAACTNPETVKTLVEMCFEAGAKEVVVTDHSTNQAARTFLRSGIQAAAKQAGAKVLLPSSFRMKKMSIRGEWFKEWEVFLDVYEADKIINAPIAKHHSLSRVTLGMKNWLGAIGGARNQLHQRLDEAKVDLARFFNPALTVLDAWRILVRNGPQGGRPSDTELRKTVIAGRDWLAVDAAGATLFGIKPEELPFLKIAADRKLGRLDLERLRIEKRTI